MKKAQRAFKDALFINWNIAPTAHKDNFLILATPITNRIQRDFFFLTASLRFGKGSGHDGQAFHTSIGSLPAGTTHRCEWQGLAPAFYYPPDGGEPVTLVVRFNDETGTTHQIAVPIPRPTH